MKDLQRNNVMKWQLSLISKLKTRQNITNTSKLLNVQMKYYEKRELKLMLDLIHLNHTVTRAQLSEAEKTIDQYLAQEKKDNHQYKDMRLVKIKLIALSLAKQINQSNIEGIINVTKRAISNMQTVQQFQFFVKTIFHVKSLFQLAILEAQQLLKNNNNKVQNNCLRQIIALAKLSNNKDQEAFLILSKAQLDQPQTVQEFIKKKQPVLCALKLLIQKQKQMLLALGSHQLQPKQHQITAMLTTINNKKTIANLLQNDFNVYVNHSRQSVLNTTSKLQQINSIIASTLAHIYYENDSDVLARIKQTAFFKYVVSSKKFFIQTQDITSRNFSSITNVLAKSLLNHSKFRYSPKFYQHYIKKSQLKNQEVFAPFCKTGQYFMKHNFNNRECALKFVQFNQKQLLWNSNKQSIEKGTRWKIEDILGIVYGKITTRHLYSKVAPNLCFSFILQDRTLDLSSQNIQDISHVFSFVRGSVAIINEMHQKTKIEQQIQLKQIKDSEKSKKQQIRANIRYHTLKTQQMSNGKLIWKSLLMNLSSKLSTEYQNNCYIRKAKSIKVISEKIDQLISNS